MTYSRATAKRRDAQARPEPTSTPTPAATAAPADSSAADVDKLEAMDEDLTDAVCAALQAAIDVEEYDSRRQHAIRAAGPLGCSIVIG